MFRKLLFFWSLVFLVSCSCQKLAKTNDTGSKDMVSAEKIKKFLRTKNFDIVDNANLIVAYDIKKILIEGTVNEYKNKVVFKDTIENKKAKKLLDFIKDDSSYDWNEEYNYTDFNPVRQFLIRNNSQRIFLLIDDKSNRMGFINLDGQKVVALSSNFSNFLKDF